MLGELVQQKESISQLDETRMHAAIQDVSRRLQLPFDINSFIKNHVVFDSANSDKLPPGFFAEVRDEKIVMSTPLLKSLFNEMKLSAESEATAYTGLALRMALILTHERTHIQDRQSQIKELGFSWPLSSLHAEIRGVAAEVKLFEAITAHKDLIEIFYSTSMPRNYIMPGLSSSITEEFDRKILTAFQLSKDSDPSKFTTFIQNYYPNAIVLGTGTRKELELQLVALRKIITDSRELAELEAAIKICASPDSYTRLIEWYQHHGK